MTTVDLDPTPALDALPWRRELSFAAAQLLAERAGVDLPWRRPAREDRLISTLGPAPTRSTHPRPDLDPAAELSAAGLLIDDQVPSEVAAALARLARPHVSVDVTVALRTGSDGSGVAQLNAWHRLASGLVTTLTATAGGCELASYDVSRWAAELTELASLCLRARGASEVQSELTLPLSLLLAAGAAQRGRRPDLLAQLAHRALGLVREGEQALAVPDIERVLGALHAGLGGRLLLTCSGIDPSGQGASVGILSWVLVGDGWRELTPVTGGPEPLVALRPVHPGELARGAARLVTVVKS